MVKDFNGKEYKNFAEMCRAYDKDPTLVRARCRYKWDLETALTTDCNRYNGSVTDHKGNTYKNVFTMCKAYNIDKNLYFSRIHKGMSVEEALTTPLAKSCECEDHLGNKYSSKVERAEAYGLKSSVVENRLKKGMSLKEALSPVIKFSYKIGEHTFKNVRDAGAYFNISRTTIAKIVKMTDSPIKRQEYIDQVLRSPAYQRSVDKKLLSQEFEE